MKNTTLQTKKNGNKRSYRSSLARTLAILILIPALIAVGFMTIIILREIKAMRKADYVSGIVEYMVTSSLLIHELQKERGESSGYIGEKGIAMVNELNTQRLLTDQKLIALKTYLESIGIEQYGQGVVTQLNMFQKNLAELSTIRDKITSLSITRNESIEYFSEVINDIIGTFQEANITIKDSELSFPFTACINFIMAKEMAGIERAIMVGFVAADKPISHEDQHKWMSVLKGQDALFKAFMHQAAAGGGILDKFNNMTSGVNTKAVEDIRKQIFEKHREGGYGLIPSNVFHVVTRRIDELKSIEDALVQKILRSAERISSEKNVSLIIYSALTGATIIGMYVLCFLIARGITRPIAIMLSEIKRGAIGELDHEFVIKSKNEIGELASNFKQMCRNLKEKDDWIKASLAEKEELMKEIHHRVKNNLQIISGLLYMSRKQARNKETINVLSEASSRIDSIALVHAQLYNSDKYDEIEMQTHIKQLSENISQIYSQGMNVKIDIIPTDISLPVSTAVPCAIVFNELITNAFKHAFGTDRKGTLELSIARSDNGKIVATIKDDGTGIPENFNIEKTNTMGMSLVRNIVNEQLKGKLQINRNKGTEFIIEF